MKKKNYDYDIIVIGAGFIGLIACLMLSEKSLNVCLIEKRDLKRNNKSGNIEDKRTTAISQGTKRILDELEVWDFLVKDSQAINKIEVSENIDGGNLEFDPHSLDEGDLGYIVRNKDLRSILLKKVLNSKIINIKDKTEVKKINLGSYINSDKAFIETKDSIITANLIIGADGRYSKIRYLSNMKYYSYNYRQNSYIFNIDHVKNHNGVALERFFPEGPLAILPMKKKQSNFFQSSVVWTLDSSLGDFSKLSLTNFRTEFERRYQNYFGLVKQISIPIKYPLNVSYVFECYKHRLVLIGDAAQAIHPIAGQGFNLGVRDCRELSIVLNNSKLSGLDIGLDETLGEYSKKRWIDKKIFIESTHRLNFIFSNDNPIIRFTRSNGLRLIQKSKFLKKQFMLLAMGLRNIKIT